MIRDDLIRELEGCFGTLAHVLADEFWNTHGDHWAMEAQSYIGDAQAAIRSSQSLLERSRG